MCQIFLIILYFIFSVNSQAANLFPLATSLNPNNDTSLTYTNGNYGHVLQEIRGTNKKEMAKLTSYFLQTMLHEQKKSLFPKQIFFNFDLQARPQIENQITFHPNLNSNKDNSYLTNFLIDIANKCLKETFDFLLKENSLDYASYHLQRVIKDSFDYILDLFKKIYQDKSPIFYHEKLKMIEKYFLTPILNGYSKLITSKILLPPTSIESIEKLYLIDREKQEHLRKIMSQSELMHFNYRIGSTNPSQFAFYMHLITTNTISRMSPQYYKASQNNPIMPPEFKKKFNNIDDILNWLGEKIHDYAQITLTPLHSSYGMQIKNDSDNIEMHEVAESSNQIFLEKLISHLESIPKIIM